MPENAPSALADPWIQVFGAAALLSGALALRAPARLPPASPAPQPASLSVVLNDGNTSAAAGAKHVKMRSRTPGQWRVDKAMGPEADTPDLAKALAAAADGDRIMLAAGVYDGPFVVSKSVQLVGAGARSDVRLTSTAGATLQASAGKVFL